MQRNAIIIGATGLVGQYLVAQLSELYDKLIVIARRPPRYIHASMRFYQVNDFDNLDDIFASITIDKATDGFSCLGTTKKLAGSDDAFFKVDHDYNVNFAALCQQKGVETFFLLSAMNADKESRFFYNRVKGQTEHSIAQLGFAELVIFRPSLLLGKHKGRHLENATQRLFGLLSPLVSESLSLHPISAKRVASAMTMQAQMLYERHKYHDDTAISSPKMTVIDNKTMLAMTRVSA